jgi:hypothetical protein
VFAFIAAIALARRVSAAATVSFAGGASSAMSERSSARRSARAVRSVEMT